MELCGEQARAILEQRIDERLHPSVNLVHGPGCAICATPVSQIENAIEIAQRETVIFCAPGELMRLKGYNCDLLEIKAQGADVRAVSSPLDCLAIARDNPDNKVVYFSVGFDMTAQLNAHSIWQAKKSGISNYFLLSSHGYVPGVCKRILKEPQSPVQAILAPAQMCSVSGYADLEPLAEKFRTPIVVTGYDAIDILEGIEKCVELLRSKRASVESQYASGVSKDGNREAKALIKEVFEIVDSEWRGIGIVPNGGYRLKQEFERFDAEKEFGVSSAAARDSSVCISNRILLGFQKPIECPAFGKSCRPSSPLGATMVSNEGVCATYYDYRHDH
jgi:hydrogenase expression/formation protein HypD